MRTRRNSTWVLMAGAPSRCRATCALHNWGIMRSWHSGHKARDRKQRRYQDLQQSDSCTGNPSPKFSLSRLRSGILCAGCFPLEAAGGGEGSSKGSQQHTA